MSVPSLLLVGLPESGKTTYLTALFHLLRSGTANAANLEMSELPRGREYFIETEDAWLQFQALKRTAAAAPGRLEIPLSRLETSALLAIPDLRGEDFENLWEYGTVTEHLASTADEASGILLFVRADTVVKPPFLDQNREEIVDGPDFVLDDWAAESAPTQTKLCDVLEQLGFWRNSDPVSVVVTAWDTVGRDEQPEGWLQRQLPLLWQYLGGAGSPFRVFGVSAQGGDLTDPQQLKRLTSHAKSTDRIADPQHRRGDDLTDPIAWLLPEPA